ncbi:MAG: Pr6Pr family membrane protein [Marmoricola sp.]
MQRLARPWHVVTAVVTIVALIFQLWLALSGHRTLVTEGQPSTRTTLVRFFSYFTILSNLLVAITTTSLALGRDRDSRLWRVLRIDAIVGIAVTALVHWFFLRPLLDLHGNDYLADKLLHVVVPALAVIGWVVFGPRDRVRRTDLLSSAIYPALYMVWTLIHGAATDWYPYPFTDVTEHGYAIVLLNACGVIALLAALGAVLLALDPRLPGAHSSGAGSGSPSK